MTLNTRRVAVIDDFVRNLNRTEIHVLISKLRDYHHVAVKMFTVDDIESELENVDLDALGLTKEEVIESVIGSAFWQKDIAQPDYDDWENIAAAVDEAINRRKVPR